MEFDDLTTNDGSQQSSSRPAWMAQLPDELKENETLTRFKTIGELGKGFIETEGKLSKYIPPLGEKPTPEEISDYRKKLGIPDNPDGYMIEKTQMPEGMTHDEVLERKFREVSHQMNLTPAQVKGLYDMYQNYQIGIHNEILKSIDENRQKAVNALKDIWKGDAYTEKTNQAVRAFHTFLQHSNPPEALGGAEGVKSWFETNGLGDDPVLVWFFSKTFELIGDDKFIKGMPSVERRVEPGMLDFSKSMGG